MILDQPCEKCSGQGYAIECCGRHRNCRGDCPVQVQCDQCGGSGRFEIDPYAPQPEPVDEPIEVNQ